MSYVKFELSKFDYFEKSIKIKVFTSILLSNLFSKSKEDK